MSSDDRFKPPMAALDPALCALPPSRGPVVAIALAGLLQLAWLTIALPAFLVAVQIGAMMPIGPLLCAVGCACLYAGLWRALPDAARGRLLFVAALAFLACGLTILGFHHAYFDLLSLTTFYFATAIAASGLALTWSRRRARRERA